MGENSKIEWCHHTFNPWIGCTKVSPGCAHCYAEVETFARVQRKRGNELWGKDANRHVASDANWHKPYRWNDVATKLGTRARVFCASLSDVFEDRRDLDEPRRKLWDLIETTPSLDWLLLTKRPENIARLIDQRWLEHPRHNVWLGTTCEDQKRADERIPHLLRVPAAVRFLSCEPLLGPIDLVLNRYTGTGRQTEVNQDVLRGTQQHYASGNVIEAFYPKVHWVIAGGESGSQARPMHPNWARGLRDQCNAAGVPFLFKQWGSWLGGPIVADDEWSGGAYLDVTGWGKTAITSCHIFDEHNAASWVGKDVAGRLLDSREWNEYPVVASEAIA